MSAWEVALTAQQSDYHRKANSQRYYRHAITDVFNSVYVGKRKEHVCEHTQDIG